MVTYYFSTHGKCGSSALRLTLSTCIASDIIPTKLALALEIFLEDYNFKIMCRNVLALGAGVLVGSIATYFLIKQSPTVESEPDQVKRFNQHKKTKNPQAMDIDSVFDQSKRDWFNGKTVLVTGASRGVGLAIVDALLNCGAKVIATVRKPSKALEGKSGLQVVSAIDVTDDNLKEKLLAASFDKVDVLVNNAGYFFEAQEFLGGSMNFKEELKMIDICAVGVLRVTDALLQGDRFTEGCVVANITSQGGSIAWRSVQCPDGGDYGHHMSKAAANMAGVLMANQLRSKSITVLNLHPGFNRTDMTSKYSSIWDEEGAVDSSIGAKRVLLEISKADLSNTGAFINCEDGLRIPW